MRTLCTAFFLLASAFAARAQYCTPTFVNGCFNWRLLTVNAGDIAWTFDGIDCLDNDHTDATTNVDAGTPLSMDVETGVWCGCAVWVDLDNSGTFEDSENLYYAYTGADPSFTYSFSITLPAGTPAGDHRMRIIAPWGSDGFLDTNTNGYGPCGDYQYGNYGDFTVHVNGGGIGMNEATAVMPGLVAGPNPATGAVQIASADGTTLDRVDLMAADGRVVLQHTPAVPAARVPLDLAALPAGFYTALCRTEAGVGMVRVVKE